MYHAQAYVIYTLLKLHLNAIKDTSRVQLINNCFYFKVVECVDKRTGVKRALKVLRDSVKARREVELHWRASGCVHVVAVIIYFIF